MRNREDQVKRLAALTSVIMMAAAEAMAQDKRPSRRIVVSIPDRKLAILEDDRVLKIYPTAVGAPVSPSPEGDFTIINHIVNPTWYHQGRVVPPGKSNPLGARWLGLSRKGYGIHGTNAPSSIGRNASSRGSGEAAAAQLAFSTALREAGARESMSANAPPARASITISETPSAYLLVEEMMSGEQRHVWMLSSSRAAILPSAGIA